MKELTFTTILSGFWMEQCWRIPFLLTEAGHIPYFCQTCTNAQADHLRELIQSKDIFQIRRTGLHTRLETTWGHTVPGKEGLHPHDTHFHHLSYAGSSIHINHSFQLHQFLDPTHPTAAWMLVGGNTAKHKTRISFTANPDLYYDIICGETPGDVDKKWISSTAAKILMCLTRLVCMNVHY